MSGPRTVVSTRLHIPAARPGHVRRHALVELLENEDMARLVLVAAPPGSGKTTLLSEWAASSRSQEFAWLSLDAGDDDPVQFWTGVIEALRTVRPGVGADAIVALEAPGTNVREAVLPPLIDELAHSEGEPLVLVLDDYHLADDPQVHESVVYLLEHAPEGVRLALTTRSDPPFPLGRMRARGQLLEVRGADLRFSDDEAAGLLNGALGLSLGDDQIAQLQLRTEGWAAGLQLAGLSLRGRPGAEAFIAAFAGDDRQLVDYLGEEVLDAQPPERRAFLRRTAILERMCAPLCEALTGDPDAAATLAEIERENLFVVALDSVRRWYRYHHLFGDLLRHDLEASEPGIAVGLHARAAAWFAEQNMAGDAIHHAVAAGDFALAAELVATHWSDAFNRGRHITVARWLAQLPPERVAGDSRLWLARVWTSMDRGLVDEVEPLLADEAAPADQASAWLPVLRALHRFKIGDVGGAQEGALRALGDEPQAPPFRRTVALLVAGVAAHWRDDLAAADTALRGACAVAIADGNGLAALYSSGYLALLALDLGDLRGAQAELDECLALVAAEPGLDEHFVATAYHLAAGRLALLQGRPAGDLDRALTLARRGASVIELAAVLLARGDAAARAEARALIESAPDPGRLVAPPLRRGAPSPRSDELSERELAVLRLLPSELSQREIGDTLYVSLNTVKSHTRRIFAKLGASGREDAVRVARERGLL
ncbi:MAG TPA: LuxR C-terminal-related transcriptional regulator [Solirubrobacteraceae bacterium]|jgi:LuxR family maltose regulon positive regulatory protein|nr:LuxR C-terminal-related transcriptional regulator [Solirubrobacteraceae bacterium]